MVKQSQEGERDSFVRLVELYIPRVVPAIRAIVRDHNDAEDVIQSASLKAFEKISKLRDPTAFGSWFLRIAVNEARDVWRTRRDHINIDDIAFSLPTPTVDRDGSMDLWMALEKLPTRCKAVIVLSLSGLNSKEIAESLLRPPGTVRRILSESYEMLRMR
ncbi:MAG: RNA polymerase sigma factor [Chloroflexi bacterium]|nr:RNA polymerase sigma factor [Chloroflexota bacterium]